MKQRLELFSDAVYAIIITLMVLDLHTPDVAGWRGWRELLPAAGAYTATFVLLLVIWFHHHHTFSRVRTFTRAMFWFSGAHLFFVSLLPLTLRSIIEHPHDRTGYIVYQIVAWNALTTLTWLRWVASRLHGRDPGWKEWSHKRNLVFTIGTIQAALFIGLTYVYLPVAIALYLAMLIFLIISLKTPDTSETIAAQSA